MTDHTPAPHRPAARRRPLPLTEVSVDDAFWSPRVERVRTRTLPFQREQLLSRGLEALKLQWRPGAGPEPHIFWDSDVAKWIEAASYSLATTPDAELERHVDEAIELLRDAQQPDGYLNTYFTVVQPGRRFTDLRDAHELYCAGHLIEAGVAHAEATGRTTLLEVVQRYADLIATEFGTGPGQRRGYDGHEEIELALVKLYRVTGEQRYLDLACFFVDERGQEPYYFDREAAERGTPGYFGDHFSDRDEKPQEYREYLQAHLPVREQTEAVGHAVRAMYLYCAMADLAAERDDDSLRRACRTLWTHLTTRRMYVTGGIGSSAHNEGFTRDHHLPSSTAYAETCAAIGLVLWAHRMALLEGDAAYLDVLERALYNGVLSGMSASGDRFFYDNPLESDGSVHRKEWFGVACCPPNLARLLTQLGRFVYTVDDDADDLTVNLFVGGQARATLAGVPVTVSQRGGYPWDEAVEITVDPARAATFRLSVRLPGWCDAPQVTVAGEAVDLSTASDSGYVRVLREWQPGDRVQVVLPMPARRVWAHPEVADAAGRVSLARGPLVYCAEGADHPVPPHMLSLPRSSAVEADHDRVDGVVALTAPALADGAGEDPALYRAEPVPRAASPLVAVPYFSWDNREPGPMAVWVREAVADDAAR